MINFIFYHPYIFLTIAILFLFGVFIMVYESREQLRHLTIMRQIKD